MSNTGRAQLGVHLHPACLHPAVSVLPACTAELGRCTAQSHSHLSVLLCCTVCKAQPLPSTGQVLAASRDRGSNPDSMKVQWCHKTQGIGLNSWILNRKPLPAAFHPLGPHARPCNSLLSTAFPGEDGWKRHYCSASLHPQELISSVTPAVTSLVLMEALSVALAASARSICTCCALSRGRTSTRLMSFVSKPHPGAGVKQKQVLLYPKSDVQYFFFFAFL